MQEPSMELQQPDEIRKGAVMFQWSLLRTMSLLLLPWTVLIYELRTGNSLSHYGLYPRTEAGLWGLLTMPFLHGDFKHLYNNSFGLLIQGVTLFYFYPRVAWRVWLVSPVVGGLLVWLFARSSFHIGASGVVYSLSAFLFVSGLVRRDRASRGGAMIVALLYGGSVWGIFPLQQGVSWEGHLFGALIGAYLALFFRDVDLPEQPLMGDDENVEALEDDEEDLFPYWRYNQWGEELKREDGDEQR